jgi:Flp pilus assembly pilin Flp
MKRATQSGQAMIEYVLITVLVCLVLFTPFVGGRSVAEQLALAIANFFRGYAFLVAIS